MPGCASAQRGVAAAQEKPASAKATQPTTNSKPSPQSKTASPAKAPSPPKAQTVKSNSPVKSPLPEALREVEALYSTQKTLIVQFKQITENAVLKTRRESAGRIMIQRPDKLRWDQRTPDQSLLVSDGKKVWFYTPPFDETERGQVIERKAVDVKSQLASAVLSGNFSSVKGLRVKAIGPETFELTPKAGTAGDVSQIQLTIDTEAKQITHVLLLHKSGNKTQIELSQIELGKPIPASDFVFVPPPGVDRMTE